MSAVVRLTVVPGSVDRPRSNSRKDLAIVIGVAALTAAYATLRYNVFKGVPWGDWPGYILNKVLAVSSLVLLAWAGSRKVRGGGPSAMLMTWGGGAALAHVLLSFALLQPAYFERLFMAGKLTAAAGFSIAAGALAYVLLEIGARRSSEWTRGTSLGVLMLLLGLAVVHTAVPAAQSWLSLQTWPGYLPPLTMLAIGPALATMLQWPPLVRALRRLAQARAGGR